MPAPLNILLIEDSASDALLMQERLRSVTEFEFTVDHSERLEDGISKLAERSYDAVLLDLNLPDSFGLATIRDARKSAENTPIIVLTAMDDRSLVAEAVSNGADSYLVKDKTDGNRIALGILWSIRNRTQEKRVEVTATVNQNMRQFESDLKEKLNRGIGRQTLLVELAKSIEADARVNTEEDPNSSLTSVPAMAPSSVSASGSEIGVGSRAARAVSGENPLGSSFESGSGPQIKTADVSSELYCSIAILDHEKNVLHVVASPSLPAEWNSYIKSIPVGPSEGSCGTAVYCKHAIYVVDVETDPLWVKYRLEALQNALRACWSVPIMGDNEQVLGSLALYSKQRRSPSSVNHKLMHDGEQLAATIIKRTT